MIPFNNLSLLAITIQISISLVLAQAGFHIPLARRGTARVRTENEWAAYRDFVNKKFAPVEKTPSSAKFRRQNTANVPLTNLGFDTTYFAPVNIGTPVSHSLFKFPLFCADEMFFRVLRLTSY